MFWAPERKIRVDGLGATDVARELVCFVLMSGRSPRRPQTGGRAGMGSCDPNPGGDGVIVELGEPSSLARGPGSVFRRIGPNREAWPLVVRGSWPRSDRALCTRRGISRVEHNKLPRRAHDVSNPTSITRTPHLKH